MQNVSIVCPYVIDKPAIQFQFVKIGIFYHSANHTTNIAGATGKYRSNYVGQLEAAVNEEVKRVYRELSV
jgi:hypothetical protein